MSKTAPKTKKGAKRTTKKKHERESFPARVTLAPAKHPRYFWVVRWPGPEGKRRNKWFTNRTEALAHAKEMSAEAGEVGAAFGSIREEERAALVGWRAFVAKEAEAGDTPPELGKVLTEYCNQRRRTRADRGGITVAEAVEEFLELKEAVGVSSRHLGNLRARLHRFARDHGERTLASFTTAELSKWILNLRSEKDRPEGGRGRPPKGGPLAGRTKVNFRQVLHAFFEWATIHKELPDNPVSKTERPRPEGSTTGILKAEAAADFMGAVAEHSPRLLPFYAVRVFAGIRESEAARMTWDMIDLKKKRIILPAEITKRKRRRIIATQPALIAFLRTCKSKSGLLVGDLKSTSGRARVLKTAKEKLPEDFTTPANWHRHTFATMHLNKFHDPGKLAIELGHVRGPQILHDTYEGEATPEEAKAFWAIRPKKLPKPKNVVEGKFGAKPRKSPKAKPLRKAAK